MPNNIKCQIIASSLMALIFLFISLTDINYLSKLEAKVPPSKTPAANASLQKNAPSEEQFMKSLGDKVQSQLNAHRPKELKSATQVILLIKMDKMGVVDEVKVDTSSGVAEADQAALLAVKKAAPFGKIPVKFGDGLALKYTFRFGASKPQPLSVGEKAESDEYMNKVREKISHNWRSPDVSTKCRVTISFLIEASGKIKTASLKKSSGNKIVDDAALAAIKRAGPFEPLPEIWKSGYGVEYTLNAGPKNDIQHYKFNDVSLPDGDFKISRSGAKLQPLEYNKKIEHQLQDRKWSLEDKLKSLQTQLESASSPQAKSDVLIEMGKVNLELHQFDQAVKSLTEAGEIESGLDANSVKYALTLRELAEAHRQNNELDKACLSYQKCIDILKNQGTGNGANLKELRDSMTGFAKTLYKQNKVKEGDAIYAEIRALK